MASTKQRPQVTERPETQKVDLRPGRVAEERKTRARRWYPWIASLVVAGVTATAIVAVNADGDARIGQQNPTGVELYNIPSSVPYVGF